MHWLQRKKPEHISTDRFWKNKTRLSRSPKKLGIFSSFSCVFFLLKTNHVYRILIAYIKCHDPLSSIQQKLGMWCVPFWKKSGITFFGTFWANKSHFFKNGLPKLVLGFLHWNQCIKTLLLSYQTSLSEGFHFSLF